MIPVTLMMAISVDGKIAKDKNQFANWTSPEDKKLFVAESKKHGVVMMGENTFNTFPSPAALQNIKLQFSKLGDTIYEAKEIKIILTQPLFFKISILNAFRREIIEIFDKKRKESYKREESHIVPTRHPFFKQNLTYEANVSNSLAEKFYERHGVSLIEPAFEILDDKKGKRIMTTKHCLRRLIGKCSKSKSFDSIKEPLYLVNEKGYKFLLKFDCEKCQMEIYYRA